MIVAARCCKAAWRTESGLQARPQNELSASPYSHLFCCVYPKYTTTLKRGAPDVYNCEYYFQLIGNCAKVTFLLQGAT